MSQTRGVICQVRRNSLACQLCVNYKPMLWYYALILMPLIVGIVLVLVLIEEVLVLVLVLVLEATVLETSLLRARFLTETIFNL